MQLIINFLNVDCNNEAISKFPLVHSTGIFDCILTVIVCNAFTTKNISHFKQCFKANFPSQHFAYFPA